MAKSSKALYREFYRRYRQRVALHDDPDEAPVERVDPVKRKGYRRDYFAFLRPFRGRLLYVFVLAIIAAGLGLVIPMASKHAIDGILLQATLSVAARRTALMRWGWLMLGLVIVQQTFFLSRQWRMAILNAQVVTRLRRLLYRHLLHMPLGELSEMKTGRIVSRLSNDMDQVTGYLQSGIITPGVAGIKVVLTIILLVWINWKMAVGATLLLPPLTLINLVWVRRVRPVYRQIRKDRSDIDGRVTETFSGIRVVRGFARELGELLNYSIQNHAVIRKTLLARRFEMIITLGWGLLIPAVSLLVIWYGGLRLLAGDVSIGGIMAFQMYIMMLLEPVSVIVASYGETQQALAAMERVFDVLRRPVDKPDAPGAVSAPQPLREITLDNVSFEYRPGLRVLHGVSLAVDAGQTVALVGPSGSGKTTVTNLIARFYDPTSGTIRVNGVDLKHIRLRTYRRLLGYVPQDVFLFDGTVSENIGFSRRGATRMQIISAAERANADEFIRRLPEQYDTRIGERGVKLSGGQAQRLSIARAFLADPQVLILDEATSNLDTQSEELIQASMLELIANRTTFIIAHRLSTVMHADQIVVIDEGRIVETGRHADLMARGAKYREMVERQFRRGVAEMSAA